MYLAKLLVVTVHQDGICACVGATPTKDVSCAGSVRGVQCNGVRVLTLL